MQIPRFGLVLVGLCVGCTASVPAGPPTTITVTSDLPLLVAAFRDGPNAAWSDATMLTPTSYELVVHGPYVFGAVYDAGIPQVPNFNFDEHARTLDDELTFAITPPSPPATFSTVTGVMAQPGKMWLGDAVLSSKTASWNFELSVTPGPHDLFAITADHAFVQHALDATHDVAFGSLDVNTQGVTLDSVAFTATNLGSTETLSSQAIIETPTTSVVHVGDEGNASTTQIVRDELLVATDLQSVSVRARDGGHFRAVRMPFHPGLSTAYTLPTLFGGVSWTGSHDPTLHWTSLVPSEMGATVSAINNVSARAYSVFMTRTFIETTGGMEFTFDTGLPGFDDAWRIDLSAPNDREALAQIVHGSGAVESDEHDENETSAARSAPVWRQRPRSARVEP